MRAGCRRAFLLCKERSLLLGPTPHRQQGNHLLQFLLCSLKGKMFLGLFLIFANFDPDWFETDSLYSEICPRVRAATAATVTKSARGVCASVCAFTSRMKRLKVRFGQATAPNGVISLFHEGSVLSPAPMRPHARRLHWDTRALSKAQECLDLGLQNQTSLPGSGVCRFSKIREN